MLPLKAAISGFFCFKGTSSCPEARTRTCTANVQFSVVQWFICLDNVQKRTKYKKTLSGEWILRSCHFTFKNIYGKRWSATFCRL